MFGLFCLFGLFVCFVNLHLVIGLGFFKALGGYDLRAVFDYHRRSLYVSLRARNYPRGGTILTGFLITGPLARFLIMRSR